MILEAFMFGMLLANGIGIVVVRNANNHNNKVIAAYKKEIKLMDAVLDDLSKRKGGECGGGDNI